MYIFHIIHYIILAFTIVVFDGQSPHYTW